MAATATLTTRSAPRAITHTTTACSGDGIRPAVLGALLIGSLKAWLQTLTKIAVSAGAKPARRCLLTGFVPNNARWAIVQRYIMTASKLLRCLTLLACVTSGCSGSKEAPVADPLASAGGFCDSWAKQACNAKVVDVCAAPSVEACKSTQTEFCLGLLPSTGYSKENARPCLIAVQTAYADARLNATELKTVLELGEPCDRLIRGASEQGDPCDRDAQCDTLQDLRCVTKSNTNSDAGVRGTCEVPEIRSGGQSCSAPQQSCAPGFYCDGSNCLEAPGQNQACSPTVRCTEGFKCTGPGSETCQPKADTGASCDEPDDCKGVCLVSSSGGVCDDDVILTGTDAICAKLR